MLFGHQNNDVKQPVPEPASVDQPITQVSPTLNPLAVDPTTGVSLPVVEDAIPVEPSALQPLDLPPLPTPPPASAPTLDNNSTPLPEPPQPTPLERPTTAPAEPVPLEQPAAEPVVEPTEPAAEPEISMPEQPEETPVMPLEDSSQIAPEQTAEPSMPLDTPANDDLLEMKQQALAQLSPLVDQLEQSPEEKFRTKMMMIQSTDDQTLIKDAYEAAQQITDEKARAQALLDVINEINYFTANQQPN